MATVTVELDREIWNLMQPVYQPPKDVLREIVVIELYRRREISSGKAAELLGLERFEFVRYTSRLGIPFFEMNEEELAEEIAAARNGV